MYMFRINEQDSQYHCYYIRKGYNESNHLYITNRDKSYDKNIETYRLLKLVFQSRFEEALT